MTDAPTLRPIDDLASTLKAYRLTMPGAPVRLTLTPASAADLEHRLGQLRQWDRVVAEREARMQTVVTSAMAEATRCAGLIDDARRSLDRIRAQAVTIVAAVILGCLVAVAWAVALAGVLPL